MTVPSVTQTDPHTLGGERSATNTKDAVQKIPLVNSTHIFLENVPKPAIKTDLPRSQQRIERIDQLVYCNTLLLLDSLAAHSTEPTLEKAELDWLEER
ncbi:hypothetical protein BGZ96_008806 [Linnemannia gamsii]|uniref:Uncharacterized protein n=1 Tax=Linnemannia gamsii TaxID=64522 RepID=A0ABQ7JZR9_9FUNG|nr:hypothetical protein BGZ96_008806 [Linnemannia gamsii]